ncbi:DUF6986 family protein [Actinokineospora xionganensis]|uniref:Aldolase n=1 Tax=Actinokineospora xionganensis TaxID=2684470 RepID=A0ABR7L0W3_9PSEU|nr:aldolase/citrate lyase family protein [Actinokineospora xionganensis]MBC6446118.1 aldolase [Actinokineospora xionganensis]
MDELLSELDALLAPVDAELLRRYPGDTHTRQPVHTVYVPADRFHADLCAEWGAEATRALAEHPLDLDDEVRARVIDKLDREPIEDLRVDFEDGYGNRPDADEDAVARTAAAVMAQGHMPPFVGIRFKSLEAATRRRGVRTLDLFLGALLDAGPLPDGFVVTLPKVTAVEQVAAMTVVCERLEVAHGLPPGRLRFEIQVETPQAILGPDGTAAVARMIDAAAGRCTGLHYGTYDYSAALGVSAAHQSMEHPAADHAKAVMQLAAAGTGVRVSDGSTNVAPVGDSTPDAWRLHARLVRRSLERGFYQGWDLHPAQLVTRYAATYAFFREGLPAAAERLRDYVGQTGGEVLDEPATAQALAAFVVRGLNCGATDDAEVAELTGLDRATLDSFACRRVG